MSRAAPDPSPSRSRPERATRDEPAGRPSPSASERAETPGAGKLVLSLADGPEALNRAFLRGRRLCSRGG